MRHSVQSTKIRSFEEELKNREMSRRQKEYGIEQKLAHLATVAIFCFVLWVALRVYIRVFTDFSLQQRQQSKEEETVEEPTLVDDEGNLIGGRTAQQSQREVVEPDIPLEMTMASVSGYLCFFSLSVAVFLQIYRNSPKNGATLFSFLPFKKAAPTESVQEEEQQKGKGNASPSVSVQSPVAPMTRLSTGSSVPSLFSPGSIRNSEDGSTPGTANSLRYHRQGNSGNIQSAAELEYFLSREESRHHQERDGSGYRSSYGNFGAAYQSPNGLGLQGASNGMHVHFKSRLNDASTTAAENEWSALGIRDPDLCVLKVREWVAKQLQAVITDINRCDKWFFEQNLSAFDCNHSLDEPYELQHVAQQQGWGFGAKPQQERYSNKVRKRECLQNEKAKLSMQPSTLDNYEFSMKLDLRLRLEVLMHGPLTFPAEGSGEDGGDVHGKEHTRRQSYIVRRLKSLASQSTLTTFNPSGGEPDVWCEEYPNDAYLVAHILMHHLRGFERHIHLAHEPLTQRKELVIYVGSVGEPYFFVKYRNPPTFPEKLFRTKQGMESLFQAILILVGIINKYEGGQFGGVFGMVDLEELGLKSVLCLPEKSDKKERKI